MPAVTVPLVAVGVVALIALVAFGLTRLRHSSRQEGRADDPADSRSDRFYRTADRPAGPGAEDAEPSGQPNRPNRT